MKQSYFDNHRTLFTLASQFECLCYILIDSDWFWGELSIVDLSVVLKVIQNDIQTRIKLF